MTPTELYDHISEAEGIPMQALNPLQYELLQIAEEANGLRERRHASSTHAIAPESIGIAEQELGKKQEKIIVAENFRERARLLLAEAKDYARSVAHPIDEYKAILEIVRVSYDQELVDRARKVVAANNTVHETWKIDMLGDIAELDRTDATQNAIEEQISLITNWQNIKITQTIIALARAKAGHAPDKIDEVMRLADNIEHRDNRAQFITSAALFSPEPENIAKAVEAIETMVEVDDEAVFLYLQIAALGNQSEALEEAFRHIGFIDEGEDFNLAIAKYAAILADQGKIDGALHYADEAEEQKHIVMAHIAAALFRIGEEQKAFEYLREIVNPSSRSYSYAAFAKALLDKADVLEKDSIQPSISESPS
ncbi:hypothetical protein KBC99_00035 [Candidatus Saccharibacteria bacterium]|nr:hypothetical protein [Candidatus Saccharibacteria bacterium]